MVEFSWVEASQPSWVGCDKMKEINNMFFQEYVSHGSNIKKQKLQQNVTNPPLITTDPDKLILSILGVPELHLLIGRSLMFKYHIRYHKSYHIKYHKSIIIYFSLMHFKF